MPALSNRSQLLLIVGAFAVVGLIMSMEPPPTRTTQRQLRVNEVTPGTAEIVLRNAVAGSKSKAQEGRARQGLAQMLEKQGRFEAAAKEYGLAAKAAEEIEDKFMRGSFLSDEARCHLKRGAIIDAEKALEGAADGFDLYNTNQPPIPAGTDKTRGDVWLLKGNLLKARGKYTEAASMFKKARSSSSGRDGRARVNAAECDLLQLQRNLPAAIVACERALANQPKWHGERPATLRTLGLIYYFTGDTEHALSTHTNGWEALKKSGNDYEARWTREYIIDDLAALQEHNEEPTKNLDPLIAELHELLAHLEQSEEKLWWRISDARLRLADLLRRQEKWADAESMIESSLVAHQQRPDGWDEVPDYATIFELGGLTARDQENFAKSRYHFSRALEILEPLVGKNSLDVQYLYEEIDELGKKIEPKNLVLEAVTE